MNKKIIVLAIIGVVLLSGCIEAGKLENKFVSIERVEVYYVTNLTGTLQMSGNAQKYVMFVPYSGRYQEITGPAGLQTETDKYGNTLTTVEGDYDLLFDFKVGTTKNSLKDAAYPFNAPAKYSEFLRETKQIDPANQQIIEIAQNLTRGMNSTLGVIRALNNWTSNYLEYVALGTLDLNTEQILEEKRGSCEEHTWLYAALARSKGIPTRVAAGWVDDGNFIDWHMWAESYVPGNGWIYVEPSNNDVGTMSVPHLKLYVGPDKIPEEYYGPVPDRDFELHFSSKTSRCIFREKEECTFKSSYDLNGTLH